MGENTSVVRTHARSGSTNSTNAPHTLMDGILLTLFSLLLFGTIDQESPHPNCTDPFIGQWLRWRSLALGTRRLPPCRSTRRQMPSCTALGRPVEAPTHHGITPVTLPASPASCPSLGLWLGRERVCGVMAVVLILELDRPDVTGAPPSRPQLIPPGTHGIIPRI